MAIEKNIAADYLFEVSWEICNKVGGIHTVIASKAFNLRGELNDRHILIGPDVWRDTHENPEFNEDNTLFRAWKSIALPGGIRVRTGRWNIKGSPLVLLVDFTSLIPKKDQILAGMWEKYSLNSISGRWDYIESLLFGVASGMVIESFVSYHLASNRRVLAHFHEWMTGGGVLYLHDKPLRVGTIFTTHATALGRSLAGNKLPLYGALDKYDSDQKASELNIPARHSLEKLSAQLCDVFTTVSSITAAECTAFLGRTPNFITPNGFENNILHSGSDESEWPSISREKLLETARIASGIDIPQDAVITGTGGRYEFGNKGTDVFIDALARLNSQNRGSKTIIAFLFIPSGHNGPDRELLNKKANGGNYTTNCTHNLSDPEYDSILNKLRDAGILNKPQDKVLAFFVPSYLNGNDGVFNLSYYQLLSGLDISAFPSYYEPWGYTPLESLAFGVPTITTTLAGFGQWIKDHYSGNKKGIAIVERDEDNYWDVVSQTAAKIEEIANLTSEQKSEYRNSSIEISKSALWDNFIKYYIDAYALAIKKTDKKEIKVVQEDNEFIMTGKSVSDKPDWIKILISKQLPERLKGLDIMSRNLWWSWNQNAIDLYRSIDPSLWEQSNGNPILMLDKIPLKRYQRLESNKEFLTRLDTVYSSFTEYMSMKPKEGTPQVAYFSMEYGLDKSLRIYSGGLGILAGDYLKEASDKRVAITGVGLLYRYGYFEQKLSSHGDQVAEYVAQDFMKIPASPVRDSNGNWLKVSIALPGRNMYARLWRVDVGITELYLMDTDFEDNLPEDRSVTHHLYGGDWENRLKQELLLGIGGIRALRILGKEATVYHCNEGHAAFTGLERIREYILNNNLSFAEAVEVVRSSSLFTTHTPVPAGHDSFSEDLLRTYLSHYPERLKTDWSVLMSLGKADVNNPAEKFSMSNLASNLAQEINGVSRLHGEVSKEILAPLWPGYLPDESHIGYVTNGVHYPTWTAPEWKELHEDVFGEEFKSHIYDKSCFNGIYRVEDKKIWEVRKKLRQRLINVIGETLSHPSSSSHYTPHQIVTIKENLRDDILTIGFARRFATYKRAHLLFTNLEKLNEIVNNPEKPVQFIFAGKAHPADKAGQDLIKLIIEVSLKPQFIGKILFIPGYDMTLAKAMVQGVDVWMNTPIRPLEASGTSGEKAVMNGVMHFSVLDGWWVEGYVKDAGWALSQENTYSDEGFQNELDAATIYNIIEDEIVPAFYEKGVDTEIPEKWIGYIKNTIAKVASNFTTNRMLEDYCNKYYNPLSLRFEKMSSDDFSLAREMAFWKKRVRREWPVVEVRSYTRLDISKSQINLGNIYPVKVELYLGALSPNEVGFEMLVAEEGRDGKMMIKEIYDFDLKGFENGVALFEAEIKPEVAGVFNLAGRIYPKNPNLPHRQDFDLVKWL